MLKKACEGSWGLLFVFEKDAKNINSTIVYPWNENQHFADFILEHIFIVGIQTFDKNDLF